MKKFHTDFATDVTEGPPTFAFAAGCQSAIDKADDAGAAYNHPDHHDGRDASV